jgi:hypothetical protein
MSQQTSIFINIIMRTSNLINKYFNKNRQRGGVCACVCACVSVCARVCACMCVHACVRACVGAWVRAWVRVWVCAHACARVCMRAYTHTHTQSLSIYSPYNLNQKWRYFTPQSRVLHSSHEKIYFKCRYRASWSLHFTQHTVKPTLSFPRFNYFTHLTINFNETKSII